MAGFGTELVWWCPSLDRDGALSVVLSDLSPNGEYDGTLTNMDPASDWVIDNGSQGIVALDLDGVDDLCLRAERPPSEQSGAIGLWVKSTAGGSLFSAWDTVKGSRYFRLRAIHQSGSEGRLTLAKRNGVVGTIQSLESSLVLNLLDGEWHHVVMMSDGSQYFAWCDGVSLEITNTHTNPLVGDWIADLDTCDRFGLGASIGSTDFLLGRLDDFRVLSSITPSQIEAWYAGGRGYSPVEAATPRILSPYLIGDAG